MKIKKTICIMASLLVFCLFANGQTIEYEYHYGTGYTFIREQLTVYDNMDSLFDAIALEIQRHGYNPDDWHIFDAKYNSVIEKSDLFYSGYMFLNTDAVWFPELFKISPDKEKVVAKFEYDDIGDLCHKRWIRVIIYLFGDDDYNDIVFRNSFLVYPSDDVIWTLYDRTKKRMIDDDDFYEQVVNEDNARELKLNQKIKKLRNRR